MASLVAVACVNAGTDKAVADIVARAERSLNVGAVIGINVNGIVGVLLLCRLDQLAHNAIAVGSARILCANVMNLYGLKT